MLFGHAAEAATGESEHGGPGMGRADFVIERYGVHRFFADLDRNREYWRDGGGIVAAVLDWLATDGFQDFCEKHGLPWVTPQQYRHQHEVALLSELTARRMF